MIRSGEGWQLMDLFSGSMVPEVLYDDTSNHVASVKFTSRHKALHGRVWVEILSSPENDFAWRVMNMDMAGSTSVLFNTDKVLPNPASFAQHCLWLLIESLIPNTTECPGLSNPERFEAYANDVNVEHFATKHGRRAFVVRNDEQKVVAIHAAKCPGISLKKRRCQLCQRLDGVLRRAAQLHSKRRSERLADPSYRPLKNHTLAWVRAREQVMRSLNKQHEKTIAELNKRWKTVANTFKSLSLKDVVRVTNEQMVNLEDVDDKFVMRLLHAYRDGRSWNKTSETYAELEHAQPSLRALIDERFDIKHRKGLYHPLLLKWALNVFDKGGQKAYECVRKLTDFAPVNLPSRSTLLRFVGGNTTVCGVDPEVLMRLQLMVQQGKMEGMRSEGALVFDAMHIQKDVQQRSRAVRSGGKKVVMTENVGYGDDFDRFKTPDALVDVVGASGPLATQVLVYKFLHLTSGFEYPVASYPYETACAERILSTFSDVMEKLDSIGLRVHVVVADGAPENRKFAKMKTHLPEDGDLTSDTFRRAWAKNPHTGRNIYFLSDYVHMIKKLRNALVSHTKTMTYVAPGNGTYVISWSHIVEAFERFGVNGSSGLSLLRKVTKDHIYLGSHGKMKVNRATQVLSDSMARCLERMCRGDPQLKLPERPSLKGTWWYVKLSNTFFDCFNRGGYRPGAEAEDRFALLLQILDFFKTGGVMGQREKTWLSAKTLFDLEMLVHGWIGFFRDFFDAYRDEGDAVGWKFFKGCDGVPGRRLNQDALESFFGNVRSRGRQHTNPSVLEFLQRMKRIIVVGGKSENAPEKGNVSREVLHDMPRGGIQEPECQTDRRGKIHYSGDYDEAKKAIEDLMERMEPLRDQVVAATDGPIAETDKRASVHKHLAELMKNGDELMKKVDRMSGRSNAGLGTVEIEEV